MNGPRTSSYLHKPRTTLNVGNVQNQEEDITYRQSHWVNRRENKFH